VVAVGKALKDYTVPTPCHGQDCHPPGHPTWPWVPGYLLVSFKCYFKKEICTQMLKRYPGVIF